MNYGNQKLEEVSVASKGFVEAQGVGRVVSEAVCREPSCAVERSYAAKNLRLSLFSPAARNHSCSSCAFQTEVSRRSKADIHQPIGIRGIEASRAAHTSSAKADPFSPGMPQ
jgi:hypothetical protein